MPPPAKRRRRNVVVSSSPELSEHDEHEDIQSDYDEVPVRTTRASSSITAANSGASALTRNKTTNSTRAPPRPLPRAKTANHPHNAAPIYLPNPSRTIKSVSTSPEKVKGNRKTNVKDAGTKAKSNADISSMFAVQAERQRSGIANAPTLQSQPLRTNSRPGSQQTEDVEDISSDDDIGERKAQKASIVGLTAKKRTRDFAATQPAGSGEPRSSSQQFMKKAAPIPEKKIEEDLRPWAERFGPTNLEELAVHKKKVSDVRTWLEAVRGGHVRERLLVLKGASGTAKTTTLKLLAESMGCEVLEWHNPAGSMVSADGFVSMSAQFEEFIGRGDKFSQLDLFSEQSEASKPEPKPLDRRKNIILIEEFPNTFTRSSTALQTFRSTIMQYLATNTPSLSMLHSSNKPKEPITPVVMVISETLLTTTSASADSFTAHRLLGPEILQHPGVKMIEFNPIAPTFLAKALELVVQKESRKSGRRKTPGPLVLKRLGEVGDIRSAIASLEFLCVRGDVDGDWGSKITFTKPKRGAQSAVAMTKMEEQSLELVTRREATLGIFHAVGKVVYNKRDGSTATPDGNVEILPSYLSEYSRPKRSEVKVSELIDETGTDTPTFVAALHENYLLSCEANPITGLSSLDHVNDCIDYLSDSDLLCPSWDGSLNSSGFGGGFGGRGSGGDVLRQDELCFQLAVRGLLFSLPFPVKRISPHPGSNGAGNHRGGRGDAHKMFYPTSMKLWRLKEETESTLDLCMTRLLRGSSAMSAAGNKPAGNVNPMPLVGGASAKTDLLLERLPYMSMMARAQARKPAANAAMLSPVPLKDLVRLTSFSGFGLPSDDAEADEMPDGEAIQVAGEWATDRPVEGRSPRKKEKVMKGEGMDSLEAVLHREGDGEEPKLVLSDDDVEDFEGDRVRVMVGRNVRPSRGTMGPPRLPVRGKKFRL